MNHDTRADITATSTRDPTYKPANSAFDSPTRDLGELNAESILGPDDTAAFEGSLSTP